MQRELLILCFLISLQSDVTHGLSDVVLENNNDNVTNHNYEVNEATQTSQEVDGSNYFNSLNKPSQHLLKRLPRAGRPYYDDDHDDYTIIVVNPRNNGGNYQQQYYYDDCCQEGGGFSQYMSGEYTLELFLFAISLLLAYLVLTSQNSSSSSSGRKRRSYPAEALSGYDDSSAGKAHLLRDALAIQQALRTLEAREIPAAETLCHINRIASKGERSATILLMASALLGCALNPQPWVAMARLVSSAKSGFNGMSCSDLIVSE